MDDESLDTQLGLRVTQADADRIGALCERAPVATRQSLARHALRLGLALLESDPRLMLEQPVVLAAAGGAATVGNEALLAAAIAYAEARRAAKGRALKIAQAREAFDHAVDDWLAARK